MAREQIKDALVIAGVRNLKEYGYEHVTASNILTDEIYSQFFLSMLRDNIGKGVDAEVKALIAEIEADDPDRIASKEARHG